MRRTSPISRYWGADRGRPLDRYYVEQFLAACRSDIRGRGLEIKDAVYLRRFGTGITSVDVLDLDPTNPLATIVADLADLAAEGPLRSDSFDCFVLTQTLQSIDEMARAIENAHRCLAPGGVLLVTVPGIASLDGTRPDYWRFTVDGCKSLFGSIFGPEQLQVQSYGNVLSAVAFLMGMAQEELSTRELDVVDHAYPVIVAIRAVKSPVSLDGATQQRSPAPRDPASS
jgi:SAM-dependent methyltransferase